MIKWIRQRPAETLLFVSIVACVFEGAFRKWVFRDSGAWVRYACYFAKDFIFAAILFCRTRTGANKALRIVLIASLPLILIGAALAAVHQLNVVGSVLSLRALIVLPLLAYLAIPRLAGLKIDKVAFLVGVLTVVNASLGYLQNHSPTDAVINVYASEDVTNAVAYEDNVRAVGTFSYISGFAALATVGSWAGLVLVCIAQRRLFYIVAGWLFYAASLLCALVSISRGTVIAVLAMLLAATVSGRNPIGNFIKGLAAIGGVVMISYLFNLSPTAVRLSDSIIERHETSDDTVEGRVFDPVIQIGVATTVAPLGLGFGSEQVAGVFAETGVMSLRRFEYQFPRLVMETGLVGLIGFLITCAGTLYALFSTRHEIVNEGLRRVFVLSAFLVGSLFYTNVAFNHIASYFAWMVVAVTLAAGQSSMNPKRVVQGRPNVWNQLANV